MRHFVRQSNKGGRFAALNQYSKSTFSDEVFNNISQEWGVNGNICEILDEYFVIECEYDSRFRDYRDYDEGERTEYRT